MEANLAAMRIARQAGVPAIFNPAPAPHELPHEAYQLSDLFCPNESEAELLVGQKVETIEDAAAAGREFLRRGAKRALITLGGRGSLLATSEGEHHTPAPAVKAVDTTGAGDAFLGSLAYFLARGAALLDAIERAGRVAAISVQSPGTQSSFPYARDLPQELLQIGR
jgi:ribokinase